MGQTILIIRKVVGWSDVSNSLLSANLERIVRVHAALCPQEMSPANVHLIQHLHVVAVQLEVPDLEVLLNPGGSD